MDKRYHQIQEFVGGEHAKPFTLQLVTMRGGKKAVMDLDTYATRAVAKIAKVAADKALTEAPKHTLSVDDGPTVAGKIAPSKAPTKAKAATKPRKKKA